MVLKVLSKSIDFGPTRLQNGGWAQIAPLTLSVPGLNARFVAYHVVCNIRLKDGMRNVYTPSPKIGLF
jgi:hypothetical protein